MTKRNTLNACCIVFTFGAIAMGCLPQGGSELDPYDTSRYSPNTDGSGFAGTWVLTLNNEFVNPDPDVGRYERRLFRLEPVAGTTDTFEFTYCNAGTEIERSTVVANGDTVSLSIDGTSYVYSTTTNGRMSAPFYYGNGNLRGTLRAVRISSDPDLNAGTVGVDFSTDNTGTVKQPTVCFNEWFDKARQFEDWPDFSTYRLQAVGESDTGLTATELSEEPVGANTWLFGRDDTDRYFMGPLVGNNNTLKSTTTGIRGTVITTGDAPDPDTAGSSVLNIRL